MFLKRIALSLAVVTLAVSTSVQASNLLEECDFNKNGVIETPQMHGLNSRAEYRQAPQEIKDLISKERMCEIEFTTREEQEELARTEKELARTEKELAREQEEYFKILQILALLDPEEHRLYVANQIEKIESELKIAESKIRIEHLDSMLNSYKEILESIE